MKIIMYARPLTNHIINWQVIFCKQDSVIKCALQLHALDETHYSGIKFQKIFTQKNLK